VCSVCVVFMWFGVSVCCDLRLCCVLSRVSRRRGVCVYLAWCMYGLLVSLTVVSIVVNVCVLCVCVCVWCHVCVLNCFLLYVYGVCLLSWFGVCVSFVCAYFNLVCAIFTGADCVCVAFIRVECCVCLVEWVVVICVRCAVFLQGQRLLEGFLIQKLKSYRRLEIHVLSVLSHISLSVHLHSK